MTGIIFGAVQHDSNLLCFKGLLVGQIETVQKNANAALIFHAAYQLMSRLGLKKAKCCLMEFYIHPDVYLGLKYLRFI